MKKLFILTLALLFCVTAFAQDADTGPVSVPGLTSENISVNNASFSDGTTGWTVTDQWNLNSGALRIESGGNSITDGQMVKQTVTGKGAGTYVLTMKYKFDRNSWRGAANFGTACLYITNDIGIQSNNINLNGPGVTTFHDPTGNNWTDGCVVFTTDSSSKELEIGFGVPGTGVGKGQIYCDDFVLTYYPTMDQEAVKASLGMEYQGDLIDGNYVIEKSISLNETSKTVKDKNSFTLTASIVPSNYSSIVKGVAWSSSNEDVATVDDNGVITPAGAGTCYIIATSKADALITSQCELTVEIPEVKVSNVSVSIDGENSDPRVEETKTIQLLAIVSPEDATVKKVIWSSSDTSIAIVDDDGVVAGLKSGTVTITATSEMVNTVSGSITITVYKNAISGIIISEESIEIEQGKTHQLSAEVEPSNATYPEITWSSSNDKIATVDETGLVKGLAAGEVDIIATADGVSATCKVTVKRIEVEAITLNANSEKIVVGAEFALVATVTPSNATDPTVVWTSSNDNVATVSNGVVTGIGLGITTITAKAGEKTATCNIEVVSAVELPSESLNTIINSRFENGTWNEGWTCGSTWSVKSESNAQVYGGKKYARLYKNPLSPGTDGDFITQTITLEKPGVYSLTAYARASKNHNGGLSDDQFGLLFIKDGEGIPTEYDGVNCAKVRTSGWEWVQKSVVIKIDEPNSKVTFGFGLPKECPSISNGNLECSDFVLKYYPSTLDADAVNACENKLVYTPVKSIEITKSLTLKPGTNETLSATISPQDATNQKLVWSSSDTEIATVDETGNVKAISRGKATITATSGADALITATSTVIVEDGLLEVESLALDKTEAEINIGETLTLVANVTPAEAIVIWSSDNEEVATVDENGNVTGVAEGTATITAQAGDKTVICTITVNVPVDGIALNFEKITVETGDEFVIGYTISPENATDKNVTWTSSNEEIATIDENGKFTAMAAGDVTITATAGKAKASCTITVVAPEETDGVIVKMTYVNMDEPNKPYGLIMQGQTATTGFNLITEDNFVDFANKGWNVNNITYIQVDASAIKDKFITNATLSFEGSGAVNGSRTQCYGVGYNNSKWSAVMTYESADRSITKLGEPQWTTVKNSSSFEKLSFDITGIVKDAREKTGEDKDLVTLLVYAVDNAGGGYIKNPVVTIESTNELVYNVTFAETNEVSGVTVTVNDQDATTGTTLPDGTYSFTAKATGHFDYEGEFTVDGEDLNVEFTMTPKAIWNYTVNAVDANGEFLKEITKGEGYEGEDVTYNYPGFYLQGNTLLTKKANSNTYWGVTENLDSDNKEFQVKYDGAAISNTVFYTEAEDIKGFTIANGSNADIRCSNGLGGYFNGDVLLTTLPAGTYIIHGRLRGSTGMTAGVKILATTEDGEDTKLWTIESNGSQIEKDSEEFTLDKETDLYIYTTEANNNRMIDYVYIVKSEIPATGISLDKTEETLTMGETLALVATLSPANTTETEVTWSSSDDKVATVDEDGNVTAVYPGTATITASCGSCEPATCTITVNPKLGDANWNGEITITDAVNIANYVLEVKDIPTGWEETAWEPFYMKGADINGSGDISISDAAGAALLALNDPTPAPAPARVAAATAGEEAANNLVIGGLSTSSNGQTFVGVTLDNSMEYVAVQADIYAPDGVNFDVKAGSRIAGSHSFVAKRFDDNHMRVIIYTFSGNAFADNNEPLFEIVTDSYLADQNDIVIANILASDAKAQEYVLGSAYGTTTGVAALGFDSNAPVKVYDLNGRYVSDKVEDLEEGFYIILHGETAKKVYIR